MVFAYQWRDSGVKIIKFFFGCTFRKCLLVSWHRKPTSSLYSLLFITQFTTRMMRCILVSSCEVNVWLFESFHLFALYIHFTVRQMPKYLHYCISQLKDAKL